MARYADVECYEEHGTLQEEITRDEGMGATVILRTPWEKRFDLQLELLGPNAYPYPHTPQGWSTPYPINCSCVPDETKYTTDSDGQVIQYVDALITVQYGYINVQGGSPDDPDDPDVKTIVNENLEPNTEFLTSDYKLFAWGEQVGTSLVVDPLEEDEAPGMLFRSMNLVRQYFNVRSLPGSILTLAGRVNRDAYFSNILGLTFNPETLLFMPPSLQRTFTTEGTQGWTITLRFSYKPQTWNRFWRAKTERWEDMYKIGGEDVDFDTPYKPYPLGDFSGWLR